MIILATLRLQNFDPIWFWVCLIIASLAAVLLSNRAMRLGGARKLGWLLTIVRALGVTALLIALIKPAWLDQVRHTQRPAVAVIIDNSQSMSLSGDTAPGDQESGSRYGVVRRWLADSSAARSLRRDFELEFSDVSGQHVDPDNLPPEPDGEYTNLVRALQAATDRMRGRHAPAAVLISDGHDTTGRRDYLELDELPLPVYCIGFPRRPVSADEAGDWAVMAVTAPKRARVHNAVPVTVLIGKDGGSAAEAQLVIERGGAIVAAGRAILGPGRQQKNVTVSYTPAESGDFVLNVRLAALPGERTARNNTSMFAIRVEKDPIRVLYLEGYLRTEYTYLRQRLADDPDVDLITFVRSANPDRLVVATALADMLSAARLEELDVLILGDFEAHMLDERTYRTLRDWTNDGGGLLVLGGYHNLHGEGLVNTPLAEALPVELDPLGAQIDEPFAFDLTEEGRRHPALFVTGNLERDARYWRDLPRLRGIAAVGRAKAGATVLARHPRKPSTADDSMGYPVAASQRFGKGRCALMAADTTWRWSRLPRLAGRSDALYARFWSQIVRWLAQRDATDPGSALTVSTDAPSYTRGRRVAIRVRRDPAGITPDEGRTELSLAVRSPDGAATRLVPTPGVANPNQWTAHYFPARGGRFKVEAQLTAEIDGGSRAVASQAAQFLVQGSNLELDDPSPDPAALARIARLTGGLYAQIDDEDAIASILKDIPAEPRVRYKTETVQAWNSPFLFLFFLAALTFEWIVRRRNRMV